MNKNDEKVILCYGDSNTWGYVPNEGFLSVARFPRTVRWTGLLQEWLGPNYHVVEEGLNGRTTNIDHDVPPDRNGKRYLPPCLYSQAPIDLVVLSVGGNDFKSYYQRTIGAVAQGLFELIDIIQTSNYGSDLIAPPKILLLSQLVPQPKAEMFMDENNTLVFANAIEKINLFNELLKKEARQRKCYFLDVSREITVSKIDGLHLDEKGHHIMAEKIYHEVVAMSL